MSGVNEDVIDQAMRFIRSKLVEFANNEHGGLAGVDVMIGSDGQPTGLNCRCVENPKLAKVTKRGRFPVQ